MRNWMNLLYRRLLSLSRRVKNVQRALLMLGTGMLVAGMYDLGPVLLGDQMPDGIGSVTLLLLSEGIAFITLGIVTVLMTRMSMQIGNDIKRVIHEENTALKLKMDESFKILSERLERSDKRNEEAWKQHAAALNRQEKEHKIFMERQEKAWEKQDKAWARQEAAQKLLMEKQEKAWEKQEKAWEKQEKAWEKQDKAWERHDKAQEQTLCALDKILDRLDRSDRTHDSGSS